MFRRCLMSHGRLLMTASREHQTKLKNCVNHTPFTTYRSQVPPLTPYKQRLVFRSLSTVTPPNHDDGIGSEPATMSSSSSVETDLGSFDDWINTIDIFNGHILKFIGIVITLRFAFKLGKMMKKKFDYKKHVKRDERIEDGYLKYHITGFRGVYDKSVTAEITNSLITNSRVLMVSGYTFKSGRTVDIRRIITLPNNNYSEAKRRATFYPNVGLVVVEISDFKKFQDINIKIEETKD